MRLILSYYKSLITQCSISVPYLKAWGFLFVFIHPFFFVFIELVLVLMYFINLNKYISFYVQLKKINIDSKWRVFHQITFVFKILIWPDKFKDINWICVILLYTIVANFVFIYTPNIVFNGPNIHANCVEYAKYCDLYRSIGNSSLWFTSKASTQHFIFLNVT